MRAFYIESAIAPPWADDIVTFYVKGICGLYPRAPFASLVFLNLNKLRNALRIRFNQNAPGVTRS